MRVELSSGGYRILAEGSVFLFGTSNDLTLRIAGEGEESVCLILKFFKDDSGEQRLQRKQTPAGTELVCYNFDGKGTGLMRPAPIAELGGKTLYLMFWMYEEGVKEPKTRSVKYTLFCEEK